MQKLQRIQKEEVETLCKRIPQIELEFSDQFKHDSEKIKHECEAKDREVSFVSIFL